MFFGVSFQTVTRGVAGSGHQVESCDISIKLCKGIYSPLVPSSDLQVSTALSVRLFA